MLAWMSFRLASPTSPPPVSRLVRCAEQRARVLAPPSQLVYGGREDLHYYGDLWLLDVASRSWRRLDVAGGAAPSGRDHHGAALFRGDMVVFGEPPGCDVAVACPSCGVSAAGGSGWTTCG